uniref:Uncharacterized protein n=1 Tax=Arion vulgaris TaxID=1028688 RepID=A0A0B7BJ27_9EUPU
MMYNYFEKFITVPTTQHNRDTQSDRFLQTDTSNGTETTHANRVLRRAARLDRIYVPSYHHISKTKHFPETLIFTDHKVVITTISTTHADMNFKRSPHWKFSNTLLLNKTYVEHIKHLILTYTNQVPIDNVHNIGNC